MVVVGLKMVRNLCLLGLLILGFYGASAAPDVFDSSSQELLVVEFHDIPCLEQEELKAVVQQDLSNDMHNLRAMSDLDEIIQVAPECFTEPSNKVRPCFEEPCDDDRFTSPPTPRPTQAPTTTPGAPVQVDILFMYTNEVFLEIFREYWDHSLSTIMAAINQALTEVANRAQQMITLQNTIFQNSQVIHSVQKVGVHLLTGAPTESAMGSSSESILQYVGSNLSTLNIPSLRDSNKADLVTVLVKLNGMGSGGSAAMGLTSPLGAPEDSFLSVVKMAKSMNRYQFAHEIGHNFGCGHDFGASQHTNTVLGNGRGFIVRDSSPGVNGKRTIMAYPTQCGGSWAVCQRIPHYSNPNVYWNGLPTGAVLWEADAASTLNQYMPVVALYRT